MSKPPHLILPLVLLVLLSLTTAEIKTLSITSDSRAMILFEKFGFTPTGHVTVSVHSVSVDYSLNAPNPVSSRLGFFLLSEESLLQVILEIQENPYFCVLDSHYILSLFTFHDLSPPPLSSFNQSYAVTAPNEYSLFFANCAPETRVSMSVKTEVYNLDRDGSKDYLSAGLTQLPALFTLYFLAYAGFSGLWIYVCYNNKRSVHRIHLLMSWLLLMKALNLICAAEYKHYVKVTGTPHGWDVLFYIFQFIREVSLFTVIVLIATGRSFLQEKVLMAVIPLQVLANIASVVIGETGPFIKDWVTWNQVFLLIDIICCGAIIFPIVWSIRSLRENSKTDGKAARNLAKLQLFRQFYIVVIGYLFFTRFAVFALKTMTAYKYQWVSNAAEETASLVFYVAIFYMFRPVDKNEYFVLDKEEEEAAELALRDEEFVL
ncbi:hypothetical protein OIU76_021040 [Salix suchowensis]|uniref:Uncharacterized protein n=1 Tax=Salix suchowensis TaxID=1278906 RepID=A0ABQ8ZPI2_9ROSI|nr:protein CANDIDATE G-PROTEIN COUPLED RECEPTOR [Salix suchowensis]KAJ6300166.1 hypothetical protein OIU76_021040 [Salix suchowensis]KAJ6303761.1 hypothetical protein OIU77_017604 [Salix suchowensis]